MLQVERLDRFTGQTAAALTAAGNEGADALPDASREAFDKCLNSTATPESESDRLLRELGVT